MNDIRHHISKTPKTLFALIVVAYMAVGMIRSVGLYGIFSMELSISILTCAALLSFFTFSTKAIANKQLSVIGVFLLLFLYSIITSRYPNISLTLSFFALASSILFASLVNADQNMLSHYPHGGSKYPVTDVVKLAFIACVTIHAVCLVFFYLFEPERTTGLMDDYSQASMLVLLAYGLAYPLLKDKVYFTAFSLLYFTAFFTTFSRTANFLLLVLFIALFILELKNDGLRKVLKLTVIAMVALTFVYWYPELVGETTVDRGGLAHFSSLNSRTIYWQTAWQAIQQKPFVGHGLGLFSFTGINEAQPFNIILYVHNDYLQIWHDLGIFWLLVFIGTLGYLLLRFSPLKTNKGAPPHLYLSLDTSDPRKFLAWSMLITVTMYMGINFLILNIEFQLAIAILITDLLRR